MCSPVPETALEHLVADIPWLKTLDSSPAQHNLVLQYHIMHQQQSNNTLWHTWIKALLLLQLKTEI